MAELILNVRIRLVQSPRLSTTQPAESPWQQERLYFDNTDYFAGLLADITAASEEILLESYIFSLDKVGTPVLAALAEAAQRGLRVRILIDGLGSSDDAATIAIQLNTAGAELRIFHPLPWNFAAYRWSMRRRNVLTRFWRFVTQVNHRNHRKLCCIDGRIAWLGSFNITEGRVEAHPVGRHETGVRLTGSGVELLRQDFFQVWQHKQKRARARIASILSNHSRSYRKRKNRELLRLVREARSRIWITNAYFSPSVIITNALKAAVRRGVDVQVIVPSRSDFHFFPALTRTFYADLLAAGVKIYEYSELILHSKTMLIDQQLIVGSTNLNYRSFFHDLELDAILSQPATIQTMENKFCEDVSHSDQITLHRMHHFPRTALWFGWLSRTLRYWF